MREPRRVMPLIIDESELHLRTPVRKADDLLMRQSGFLPNLRIWQMFDHIDMRVSDLARCRPLYDALLPALGFTRVNADEESVGYHPPDENPNRPFVWIVEDVSHKPGSIRIAFAGQTREDVDRLSEIARKAGATAYEAPAAIKEYGPNYYASFFEDAEGNKLEICCRRVTS